MILSSAICEKIEHAWQHGVGKKPHRREIAARSVVEDCSMASSGMPALSDIVIASDVATRATAQIMLLVSFMICAAASRSPA